MSLGSAMSVTVDVVGELRRSHELLSGQADLSPRNPVVNELLGGLVRYATSATTVKIDPQNLAALKSEGLVASFRELCHRAEYLLEEHFATQLCAR